MLPFGELLIYIATFFGLYTTIYFLLTVFETPDRIKYGESTWYPVVSVCIPCFNEENTVEKTLRSLTHLDYKRDKLEIIVVDDGSTDKTFTIAKQFADAHRNFDIKVLYKKNGGKHTALNLAIEKSRGEFFGALDADSFVDRYALRRIVRFFEDKAVSAVTPSMKIYKPSGFLQRIQAIEYLIGIFLRKAFAELGSINVTPGPFSMYRKSMFDKLGTYHSAHNTEDIEMALRIQRHHGIIENASDAFVYTIGPKKFKMLYNQRVRWYYGFLRNIFDYKDLFSKRHGNLGLFILPSSLFSVLLLISLLTYQLILLINNWIQRYLNLKAVNFNLGEMQWFNFELFFINTDATVILGIFTFLLAISIIYIAKEISDERNPLVLSYVFFLAGYWLLYAFWWIVAISKVIRNKEVTWGHKSGK